MPGMPEKCIRDFLKSLDAAKLFLDNEFPIYVLEKILFFRLNLLKMELFTRIVIRISDHLFSITYMVSQKDRYGQITPKFSIHFLNSVPNNL